MRLTLRQKITLVILSAYWVALIIATHIPIPKIVYQAHVSDKWLHFLAFMNLVFLLWFSFRPEDKVNWRSRLVWLLLLAVCAYGGLDEAGGFTGVDINETIVEQPVTFDNFEQFE